MKSSMNDVSHRSSFRIDFIMQTIFFLQGQPKKHFQEAQKASRRRAGISFPWLSQLRRAILAGEGTGWEADLVLSLSRRR